jgi:hypothetical protein
MPSEVRSGYDRSVDWGLLIIDAEAVAVDVGTRMKSRLCRRLNAGHSA